jgi:uncharacterized protein
MGVQTWYVDLTPEECESLLASAPLGRLAVVVDGRPEIFPVVHVYDDRTRSVVFPSRAGTKLHGALHWPYVAFEVDALDADGDGGWSVLAVGRAELVTDAGEIERYRRDRRVTWAGHADAQWVRVVVEGLTGRRVGAVTR